MNRTYKELYLQLERIGYENADKMMSEVYKLQKTHQIRLVRELSNLVMDYHIEDNKMSLKPKIRRALKSKLFKEIHNMVVEQKKLEKDKIQDVLYFSFENKYNSNQYLMNIGINFNIKLLSSKEINEVVDTAFKGELWKDRVGVNKTKFKNNLSKEVKLFLNGKTDVNDIKNKIVKEFGTNAYETMRLVETEVCRCQASANDKFAIDNGIEEQEYSATLDRRTCEICRSDDGKRFKVDDVDKPVIPRHPLDRCCYIDVPFEGWKAKVRRDNESGEIIPYMTYSEWQNNNMGGKKSVKKGTN